LYWKKYHGDGNTKTEDIGVAQEDEENLQTKYLMQEQEAREGELAEPEEDWNKQNFNQKAFL